MDADHRAVGGSSDAWSASLRHLVRGAALLHLSVETPDRVPGWDAVVLTASGAEQARLYELQLAAARRRGLLGGRTLALVAEDPGGRRIGSGGATLNALRRLREAAGGADVSRWRVLMIHAGGDSRRVPWAGVFGKCFIPFPLFADPDRAVPAVFDHQLAVAAPLALRMGPSGGLLSMAGDVLPLFDGSRVALPERGACVVTVPAPLDTAGRHGVIVAEPGGRVVKLLQKASADVLVREGALVGGGAALLDTGIYGFGGAAYAALLALASRSPDPVEALLRSGAECSLYEELASAFVPSRHGWLRGRVLGEDLFRSLGGEVLYHQEARDLRFVHFGTTAEALQHLSQSWSGRLARTALSERGSGVAPSALVLVSEVDGETIIGEGSLVYGCRLPRGARIGNRCVAVGVWGEGGGFRLRDNCCLWQAALKRRGPGGAPAWITAVCGVDDNPKAEGDGATFCNRSMGEWLRGHGIGEDVFWHGAIEKTLWHARLFPLVESGMALRAAEWMAGDGTGDKAVRAAWLQAERLSMARIQAESDGEAFGWRESELRGALALDAIRRAAAHALERNVSALASQCDRPDRTALVRLAESAPEAGGAAPPGTPGSRLLQVKADLLLAGGETERAGEMAARAFHAVHREVAGAVRAYEPTPVAGLAPGTRQEVRLPVRFDIAGGWSDTPPYCLERPARVLNLAMELNGERPVGAEVEALAEPVWEMILDDAGLCCRVAGCDEMAGEGGLKDPYALLRTALMLGGYGLDGKITQGVRVRTWAHVPKGSGLGTSSILGAALVTALQRLAGRPADPRSVSDLVLLLEQRMTTGGGWQDQIGGLVPGIKCTSSAPALPIRLNVESVPLVPGVADELQRRLVVAFTGIDRLAKNVLQIVVGRYLRRDRRALSAIARLVELAGEGRSAVSLGDFEELGRVMAEAWEVHQELDPHCSNADVDAIFRRIEDFSLGGKLAGAGGGGFLGVLAKDAEAAGRIREILGQLGRGIRVYEWRLWTG
jgi:fucokinase